MLARFDSSEHVVAGLSFNIRTIQGSTDFFIQMRVKDPPLLLEDWAILDNRHNIDQAQPVRVGNTAIVNHFPQAE